MCHEKIYIIFWVEIFMEIIVAITIAVVGWIVNHCLSIRAQRRAFINNIENEARIEIAKELREYYLQLHTLFEETANLIEKTYGKQSGTLKSKIIDRFSMKIRSIVSSFEFRPSFILVLEEYETLLPKTKMARIELQRKHAKLKTHLDKISETITNTRDENKILEVLKTIDASAIAAQKWLTQDLLVIIQNITLGKFTGNKVEQWGIQGEYPVRHPRFILDTKGNIQLKKFE